VRERLRLLYGDQFRMDIHSREGDGTQIRIEIPELVSAVTSALI
jgi:sensor histidine kinase YesM